VDVYRDLVLHYLPYILQGVTVTIRLTFFSLLLSVVLGLVGAIARTSRSRILRGLATAYVEIIRGTPALLQLFIIYFGLANYQVRLSGMTAAIIALGVLGGAYLSETFRAGIEAVDRGQVEAAKSLGMRGPVIMRRIVLPQAVLIILPPFRQTGVTPDAGRISVRSCFYRAVPLGKSGAVTLAFRDGGSETWSSWIAGLVTFVPYLGGVIGLTLALLYASLFAGRLPGPGWFRGALFSLLPWLFAITLMAPTMAAVQSVDESAEANGFTVEWSLNEIGQPECVLEREVF